MALLQYGFRREAASKCLKVFGLLLNGRSVRSPRLLIGWAPFLHPAASLRGVASRRGAAESRLEVGAPAEAVRTKAKEMLERCLVPLCATVDSYGIA